MKDLLISGEGVNEVNELAVEVNLPKTFPCTKKLILYSSKLLQRLKENNEHVYEKKTQISA